MDRFTPPSGSYDGYIFDCDGTLADTMVLHHRAWKQALAEAGATFVFSWDIFTSRAGMSIEQTVVELSVQFDVVLDPIRVAQRQKALYRELERDVKPIHSVAAFARRVSQVAPVAVASGSDQPHVESTLRAIGMSDVFSIIITPADVAHGKPHPDMFLLAAARMTVDPARCLVIEDAEFGFEAARRAGMQYAKVLPPLEDTRYS